MSREPRSETAPTPWGPPAGWLEKFAKDPDDLARARNYLAGRSNEPVALLSLVALLGFVREQERARCAKTAESHGEWAKSDPGRFTQAEQVVIFGASQCIAREIRDLRSGEGSTIESQVLDQQRQSARVAQSVEHPICNGEAAGSMPATGSADGGVNPSGDHNQSEGANMRATGEKPDLGEVPGNRSNETKSPAMRTENALADGAGKSAHQPVLQIPVIPINEEHQRIVDELVAKAAGPASRTAEATQIECGVGGPLYACALPTGHVGSHRSCDGIEFRCDPPGFTVRAPRSNEATPIVLRVVRAEAEVTRLRASLCEALGAWDRLDTSGRDRARIDSLSELCGPPSNEATCRHGYPPGVCPDLRCPSEMPRSDGASTVGWTSLSDLRLQNIADWIGSPATREEERSMALDILKNRERRRERAPILPYACIGGVANCTNMSASSGPCASCVAAVAAAEIEALRKVARAAEKIERIGSFSNKCGAVLSPDLSEALEDWRSTAKAMDPSGGSPK